MSKTFFGFVHADNIVVNTQEGNLLWKWAGDLIRKSENDP